MMAKMCKSFSSHWRLTTVIFLLTVFAGAIVIRLFMLQVAGGSFYVGLAQNQQQTLEELVPQRGEIFIQDEYRVEPDQGYYAIVTNRTYQMVYLVPREIEDDTERIRVAVQLSPIINEPEEAIERKLNKREDPYEPLASKLTDEQVKKIRDLNLPGVHFAPENWRFYPAENLLSHVVGFVGFSGDKKTGRYGLESHYQKKLSGESGLLEVAKDAIGRFILAGDYSLEPAEDGDDLVLGIDQNIQFTATEELRTVMEKWGAESGTVIVMEPETGKILAMANLPDFNPNEYSKVEDINVFLNPATQELFEPGSVFKPITMASGIDSGRVSVDTSYQDTGILHIGGYTITNAAEKVYGYSSMTKVLEKSINTGAVFVQRKMGPDLFSDYVQKFGLGEPTGIDLDGEVSGNLSNLRKGGPEINFATASFGQGVAVTPIELITALGAIANRGKLMTPYLVEKFIHPDGSETIVEPKERRQIVSKEAAGKVVSMLVSVVDNEYKRVELGNYFVAAKTGTAQIPNLEEGGYGEEFIHSFVGWAPAFDPKFIILLKMDKPKGIRYAADSLSGPFSNLAKYILDYYEIPPER